MFQAQGVYLRKRLYIGGGNTGDHFTDMLVFQYNPLSNKWVALPPTLVTCFGLCKLEGELVAVGGLVGNKASTFVSIFDSFTKRWKDSLPPLENARHSPSCTSVTSAIIVAGGVSPEGEPVSSVEVLKSDTFQWYTASYLSRSASLSHLSISSLGDTVYVLGGYQSTTASSSSRVVHSCPLELLLSYSGMTPYAWLSMPDTPNLQSTAASLGACLLSLGGTTTAYTPPVHQSIHAFSPATNSWLHVGELPYAFCHGTAVSLPNNELFVMGGWVQPGKTKRSKSVYRGSVTMSNT